MSSRGLNFSKVILQVEKDMFIFLIHGLKLV